MSKELLRSLGILGIGFFLLPSNSTADCQDNCAYFESVCENKCNNEQQCLLDCGTNLSNCLVSCP